MAQSVWLFYAAIVAAHFAAAVVSTVRHFRDPDWQPRKMARMREFVGVSFTVRQYVYFWWAVVLVGLVSAAWLPPLLIRLGQGMIGRS